MLYRWEQQNISSNQNAPQHLLCQLITLFFEPTGALCYAELGTIILKSGAEYVYLYESFGAIPAYIFAWSSTLVFKPPQISIIAITFGAYMAESLLPSDCQSTVVVAKLFAVLAISKCGCCNAMKHLHVRICLFFFGSEVKTAVKPLVAPC